jgi:hypothetical protein
MNLETEIKANLSLEKQFEFLKSNQTKVRDRNCKAVECLDMDGNVLAKFKSGAAARKVLNVPQEEVSMCCRGHKSNINGYTFRFAIDDSNCYDDGEPEIMPLDDDLNEDGTNTSYPQTSTEQTNKINFIKSKITLKSRRSNAKAVECLDQNNVVVATYRSGIEAAHAMGVQHGEVSLACRGIKDNIKGYRFRFEGEDWVDAGGNRLKKDGNI